MAEKTKYIEFEIDNYTYTTKDGWDYLNRSEFIGLAKILASTIGNEYERALLCLAHLIDTNIKWFGKQNERTSHLMKLDGAALRELIFGDEALGWIWEESCVTAYTIRNFWHKGIYYVGPVNDMLHVSTVEINTALTLWEYHCKTKDIRFVDSIMAVIFRPINPLYWTKLFNYGANGDKRMPLSPYWYKKRVERFADMDPGLKLALVIQFIGHLKVFQSKFPNVWSKKKNKQVTDDDKSKQRAAGTPVNSRKWTEIMLDVGEKHALGDLDKIERIDKDRFFVYLDKIMREHKKAEMERKRLKK